MLTIRKDQMQALKALALEGFVVRLHAQLASPNGGTSETLLQEVREGVSLARLFHLDTERDVAALLITLKTLFGSCAPSLPRPALSILTTWGMAPEEKLRRFVAWASQHSGAVPDGR